MRRVGRWRPLCFNGGLPKESEQGPTPIARFYQQQTHTASSNIGSKRNDEVTKNTQANRNNLKGVTEARWVERFEFVDQSLYLLILHRSCHINVKSPGI